MPGLVEDALFKRATLVGKRHRRREIQVAARLDQGEKHSWRRWGRSDALDLGARIIAVCAAN